MDLRVVEVVVDKQESLVREASLVVLDLRDSLDPVDLPDLVVSGENLDSLDLLDLKVHKDSLDPVDSLERMDSVVSQDSLVYVELKACLDLVDLLV